MNQQAECWRGIAGSAPGAQAWRLGLASVISGALGAPRLSTEDKCGTSLGAWGSQCPEAATGCVRAGHAGSPR